MNFGPKNMERKCLWFLTKKFGMLIDFIPKNSGRAPHMLSLEVQGELFYAGMKL